MRVLIAIHGFLPTHRAGAERAAERIARYLISINYEVEVFALETYNSPDVRLETDTYQSITCHRLHYDISNSGFMDSVRFENQDVAQKFREVLLHGNFDLMHIVSGYLLGGQVIDIAHELGVPVAITLTEYWFMCGRLNLLQEDGTLCTGPETHQKCAVCSLEEKRRYKLPKQYLPNVMNTVWAVIQNTPLIQKELALVSRRQTVLRSALNRADLVISPSNFLISKFGEFGFDTDNWVMIRHGIDHQLQPALADESPQTLRVGYIGQLKPHKGLDLLVDAVVSLLGENRNLSLDIWGIQTPGAYLDQLEAKSRPFPDVRWRGGFHGDELAQVFNTLDVVVIPSRWYENCPTVILEAYRMQTPVIATRLGGMIELVGQDKGGLSFELNNSHDLAAQIRRLLDDPQLLPLLKQNIPYVKTGTEEIAEIVRQYQKLVAVS